MRILLLQLDMNHTWVMPRDLFRYYLAKHVVEGLMVKWFQANRRNTDNDLTFLLKVRDWQTLCEIGLGGSIYRNMLTAPSRGHQDVPRYFVNRALLRIGGSLQRAGFHCDYFNLEFPESTIDSLIETLKQQSYGLVCVSAITPTISQLLYYIAPALKKTSPNTKIVVGGHHVTFADVDTLKRCDAVDYVIRGEGEEAIVELAHTLSGQMDKGDVDGLTYRLDNRKIIRNPDRLLIQDLSDLADPDYTLLDPSKHYIYYFLVSRGCIYNCAFCADSELWRHTIRFHNMKRITAELQQAIKWLGSHISMICADSNSMLNEDVFMEFVESYNSLDPKPDIFNLLTRSDTLTTSRLKMVRRMPCISLDLGVENADNYILEKMNKKITFETSIEAFELVRQVTPELKRNAIWVVAFPGENARTREKNLTAARMLFREDLVHDIDPSLFVPHVGTPPFKTPDEFGMKIHTYNWIDYNYHRYSVFTTNEMSVDFMWNYMLDFYDLVLQEMFVKLLEMNCVRDEGRMKEFINFSFECADLVWKEMHRFYLNRGWNL